MNERGLYIAFEGWEASGKSTQAELLASRLGAQLSREPGGTELGLQIREMLLGDGPVPLDRAEALLFAADRAQHIAEVVRPALEDGRSVITDRSYGSTLAYQGYGRGQPIDELMSLVEWASDGVLPDIVILLDVPLGEADGRLVGDRDRLEREEWAFSERVLDGFAQLASADPDRWVVVDGTGLVDDVARRVWDAFEARR